MSSPQVHRIAVVSIGRSGTSLISRILDQVLGISFGNEADHIPRNHSNPDGYFENAAFMAFNIRLLESVGASVLLPPERHFVDRLSSTVQEQWIEEARRLLAQYAPAHEAFGWKDPRLSFTLPVWSAACPGLRVIVPFRHPGSVMSSIAEQLGCPIASLSGLWHVYYAHVFDATVSIPRCLVDYDGLLADPWPATASMARFCGIEVDEREARVALREIVKPQQSHHSPHRSAAAEIALDDRTRALYTFFRDRTARSEQPGAADFYRLYSSAN